MTDERTKPEKKKMTSMTAIAPKKAAARMATKPDNATVPAVMLPPRNSMTKATPRPAPLLMPKMPGSAKGLRKAVCNMRPLTAKAPPASVAVMACGRRDCNTIYCQAGRMPSASPVRILMTSEAGILTEPTRMLTIISMMTKTARKKHFFILPHDNNVTHDAAKHQGAGFG